MAPPRADAPSVDPPDAPPTSRDTRVPRGERVLRSTGRLFTDLAIAMVGLGVVVGLAFPSFAHLLGVPRQYVGSPAFALACVGAGVLMGVSSWGLARTVVGRRLQLLGGQLTSVAAAIEVSGLSGRLSTGTAATTAAASSASGSPARNGLSVAAGALDSLLDVLERGKRLQALVGNASDVVSVVDARGEFTYVSPSADWVLGYPPQELVGTALLDLLHPEDVAAAQGHVVALFGGAAAPVVTRLRNRDGTYRWCETVSSDLRDDPSVTGVVLSTRDVSERRGLEEDLRRAAFHDHLTGLPNRALFMRELAAAEAAREAGGTPLAVVFLDLDDLKPVNDSLGHDAGDALLVAVASRVSAAVRPGDVVARLAGDEFAILLTGDGSAATASTVAERVVASSSELVRVGDRDVRSGLSAGVAAVATAEAAGIGTLRAADLAMYVAKTTGKNRVVTFTPDHHHQDAEQEQMRAELESALEGDQLELGYEPVWRLPDGPVVGYEARCRWHHPALGLVPADEVRAVAEQSGLVVPIGRWVLGEAVAHAARWRAEDRSAPLTVAVPVSSGQLERPDLAEDVAAALARSGLAPSSLVVEISESSTDPRAAGARATLAALSALGVRVMIDDAGTGTASLAVLRALEVDALRVGGPLVAGVVTSSQDRAAVSAIVALADAVGAEVLAGDVATAHQAAVLHDLGVVLAQGPSAEPAGRVVSLGRAAATVVG